MSMFSKWAKKSGVPGWDKSTSAKGTIFEDFAAMPWTDRSENEWTKFLQGKYTWKDYLSPGGVIGNPGQQVADPGNFWKNEDHQRLYEEGAVSNRTGASALVAGSIYGAAGAPGLMSSSGSGAAGTAGGSGTTVKVSGAGLAGAGSAFTKSGDKTLAMENGDSGGGYDYSPVNPDYSSNIDPSYGNAAYNDSANYDWNVPSNYYDGTNAGLDDQTQSNIDSMSQPSNPQVSYSTGSSGTGSTGTGNDGKTNYTPYLQALGSLAGAYLSYKGDKANADAIKEGSDQSSLAQLMMFDKAWQGYQPYRTLGEQALPYYQYATTGQGTPVNIEASPLYQWQKDKGTEAINEQLAARGLYGSGAGLQSLSDFYRGLGAEETNRQYNRYLDAVNIGRGAQTSQANAAMTTGQTLGNLYANTGRNLGQARQGLYHNAGDQIIGGLGSYLDWKQNQ